MSFCWTQFGASEVCGLNFSSCEQVSLGEICQPTCRMGYADVNETAATSTTTTSQTVTTSATSTTTTTTATANATNVTSNTSTTTTRTTTRTSTTTTTTDPTPADYICPLDNTDPEHAVGYYFPFCQFETCVYPDLIPDGYVRGGGGGWQCADGYSGRATVTCESCSATFVLAGCLPLVPCAEPSPPDPCAVDTSNCSSWMPGSTCELRCRGPANSGSPTTASCPADNVDPAHVPNHTLPDCDFQCPAPEPANVTEEYTKTVAGEWACAQGYTGTAALTCDLHPGCEWRSLLMGCALVVPCAGPALGRCDVYDAAACGTVAPGGSCSVPCKPHRSGPVAAGTRLTAHMLCHIQ